MPELQVFTDIEINAALEFLYGKPAMSIESLCVTYDVNSLRLNQAIQYLSTLEHCYAQEEEG